MRPSPPTTWPVFTGIIMLLSLAGGAGLPTASANRSSGREFSSDEQRKLRAGELVMRMTTERRGSLNLIGGTSWQVIRASADVVWQALLDTSHYHRMMPQVLEARLVQDVDAQRTVYVRQGTGPIQTSYYLNVKVHDGKRDITFVMDETRPHDLRAAWGFYTVRPYGKGTLLAYGIMADIGGGLVTELLRPSVHEWMLKTPWMIKRFVEGSGRWIYKED